MLECISQWLSGMFPEGFHPLDMAPTLGFIIIAVLILGVLIRAIADKASRYNHALASAVALLFLYVLIMMTHHLWPEFAGKILNILPLVEFNGKEVTLYQFDAANITGIFREFLYAYILSLVLIGLDDMIPDAKNAGAWIVLQLLVGLFSLFVYWIVISGINHFAPELLDSYAPLILGCILLFMVLLGILKVVLGLLLVAVNPLLGAVAAFFNTSPVGKALGKAALCSLFLCAVFIFMGNSGLATFALADLNLVVCGLPLAVLLCLWFVVGFLL